MAKIKRTKINSYPQLIDWFLAQTFTIFHLYLRALYSVTLVCKYIIKISYGRTGLLFS